MVTDWSTQLLRSLLFAPGNHPRKVVKVGSFGADALVLDLEDAVAIGEKEKTREAVRAALPTYSDGVVSVRINGLQTGLALADLDAIVCPELDAVLVPKVESPEMLTEIDVVLNRLERRDGIAVGTIRVLPQIETALGIVKVDEIALQAPKRVHTLIFGMADFTAELGVDLTAGGTEILYARSRVVVAARAAGLAQPIDGPYLLSLHDHAGLVEDCRRVRQLGFAGKVVIYPPHVAPVNAAFSALSDEERQRLGEIVAAFEAAEAAGSASLQVNGVFVDYPIYKRALHKLRLAKAVRSP